MEACSLASISEQITKIPSELIDFFLRLLNDGQYRT